MGNGGIGSTEPDKGEDREPVRIRTALGRERVAGDLGPVTGARAERSLAPWYGGCTGGEANPNQEIP